MFKRRKPLSILQTIREFFWPSMGWGRAFSYIKHRILRLSDSPRNIALGLAIGAGVSFSPIMTTHFLQAGCIAYILRANIPASLIGTILGNPWTFPFIWWSSLSLGSFIFSAIGMPVEASPPENMTLGTLWDMLLTEPLRIAFPMLLGGYILCIIAIITTYPIYLSLVKGAKRARVAVIQRKAHKTAKQMTGQKR